MTDQVKSTPQDLADEALRTRTVEELEAEVLRTRSELAATVDALAGRLSPRAVPNEAADAARRVVRDAVGTDPAADPEKQVRARIMLGVAVAGVAGLVVWLIRH